VFPTSYTGSIKLEALAASEIDTVLNRVEQELHKALAVGVSRTGHKISFRGGMFRPVWNWNVLVQVGHGDVEVLPGSPGILRYRFSCTEVLIFATIAAVVFGLLTSSALVFVGAWLWLFGMNYLIGAIQIPRFIRRSAGL